MKNRLYLVTETDADGTRTIAIVEAASPARALRHVTASRFTVSPASALEVAAHMTAGGRIETIATADDA